MNVIAADDMSRRAWRGWALGLTFISGIVYVTVWKHEAPRGPDGRCDWGGIRLADEQNYYVHCAERVADQGLSYLKTEDSLRSPPLPWLWLLLFGRSVVVARAANIVSIIVASWLIAAIVRDRWGRRLALVAFVLCALGYQVVLFGATVLTEPLAFVWVCASLWAVHRAEIKNRVGYVILAGVFTAIASYGRPSLQLWPFAVAGAGGIWWLVRRLRRARVETQPSAWTLRRILLLLAVHCVVLAPWIAKNVACFGVPRIANGFGAVFFLGSEFRTDGDEPIFAGMDWPNHKVQGPGGHMSLDGERRLIEAAKHNIREHPTAWAWLGFKKIGRTLIGGAKWHFYPCATLREKVRIEGMGETVLVFAWWSVLGTIVTVCGLAGLLMRNRSGGFLFVFAIVLVGYMTALHAATFALPRFAVPLWPAFVLGCIAWIGQRPTRAMFTLLTLGWIAIVGYLLIANRWHTANEVAAERASYFAITADAAVEVAGRPSLKVRLDGARPAFNTCILVTAKLNAIPQHRRVGAALHLMPAGVETELDDEFAIGFPVIADGVSHTYLLCTELNKAWRDQKWGAVRIKIDVENPDVVRELRVRIGH